MNKKELFNNIIKVLAVKYDCDWMPQYKTRRSANRIIKWMKEMKMKNEDFILFAFAYYMENQ